VTDFAASWLDLREPVDHRSRNRALARALSAHVGGREELTIADLGCGTGSNLRASAPLLPPAQFWTLIDASQELLAAAVDRLQAWADQADWEGETLLLAKAGKRIRAEFRRADLARDLDAALGRADLVTASALFDLVSAEFIGRFTASVSRGRSAFYGVLTYDGRQDWTPADEADADLLDAFNVHQRCDKGFGPAAGPEASARLGDALRAAGYAVWQGDSAWRLRPGEGALIAQLAAGVADAARQTGLVDRARIERWRVLERTGALVGHTDLLALPCQPGA
jgi:SAM-dependent methyltransferase